MKKILKIVTMASMITLLSTSIYAEEQKKGVEALSPNLRTLLNQEMISVEGAMKSIFTDLIAGNYEKVSENATKIHNSFILKQKLTKEQGKELRAKLSPEFVEMDGAFHKQASMLSHAADMKNSELAHFYVYKMIESCTKCHSNFAQHKFPAFATKVEKEVHHH